jgi:hypothetical protein
MTDEIASVVMTSWLSTVTTKSDLARLDADAFAAAASHGYLTTRCGVDRYSRVWLVTPKGLTFLADYDPTVRF